jgi:hypothetical protein
LRANISNPFLTVSDIYFTCAFTTRAFCHGCLASP